MIEQRKLTVTLETVTPMFLAGADQQKPELRAPSFMGALRYWFRAWQGAFIADINKLKTKESLVFGGTGNTTTGSAIRLTIPHGDVKVGSLQSYNRFKPQNNDSTNSISYFWWSQFLKNESIGVIQPNTQFELIFSVNSFVKEEKALEFAQKSLWLAVHLGGFGTRSRRTLGSVHCEDVSESTDEEWLIKYLAQDAETLASSLNNSLSFFGLSSATPIKPEHHVLHPDHCRIYVVSGKKPWESWEDAMSAMATAWKMYRSGSEKQRGLSFEQKKAVGLPLKGYSPNKNKKEPERYGSPVFMKIAPVENGFVGVVTIFRSVSPVGEQDFLADDFVQQSSVFKIKKSVAL